jgi:hypothetical protein
MLEGAVDWMLTLKGEGPHWGVDPLQSANGPNGTPTPVVAAGRGAGRGGGREVTVTAEVSARPLIGSFATTRNVPPVVPAVYRPAEVTMPPVAANDTETVTLSPLEFLP